MVRISLEQAAILMSRGPIRVNAVAGSGKTTTLIEYARTRKGRPRILYLAFNRSIREEAAERFSRAGLRNVRTETAHSLAYKSVSAHGPLKVVPRYQPAEVASIVRMRGRDEHFRNLLAVHTLGFLQYYWNSSADGLHSVNYAATLLEPEARQFVDRHAEDLIGYARRLLEAMNSGRIPCLHDHYLKQYQLQRPVLPFDYLLFDEGQDASAVMLDVVSAQRAVQVIVGDEHQQIYGWRHACNALQHCEYPSFTLSTSYRFHEHIAHMARGVLSWKRLLNTGHGQVRIHAGGQAEGPVFSRAVVARSHLGLLGKAIDWLDQGGDGLIRFEGGLPISADGSTYTTIRDLLALQEGDCAQVQDRFLSGFGHLDQLEAYLKKAEHAELNTLTELVRTYGGQLPVYLQSLEKAARPTSSGQPVDCVFSTVHRSKGLEFDRVELAEDFVSVARLKRHASATLSPQQRSRWMEEVNLLYVAITRGRFEVKLPRYVWRDLLTFQAATATRQNNKVGYVPPADLPEETWSHQESTLEEGQFEPYCDPVCSEPYTDYSVGWDGCTPPATMCSEPHTDYSGGWDGGRQCAMVCGQPTNWYSCSGSGWGATTYMHKKRVFLGIYVGSPECQHQQSGYPAQQSGGQQSEPTSVGTRLHSFRCGGHNGASPARRAAHSQVGCTGTGTGTHRGIQYGRQPDGKGVYRIGVVRKTRSGNAGAGRNEAIDQRPRMGCSSGAWLPDRYGGSFSGSGDSNLTISGSQPQNGGGRHSNRHGPDRALYRGLRAVVPP